jgi:Calx-beta domain
VDELNETFSVQLSAPTAATISDASAKVTIVDEEGARTPGPSTWVAINDVAVTEGNAGTTTATFTLTRSGRTTGTSSVKYSTVNGSATAGSDYVAKPLTTVTFAAGQTTKTIAVTINGGTVDEPNETFSVLLSAPTGATISDASGTGTIVDNDAPTYLAINDVSVAEGNSGTRSATLTITRSGNTTIASSVKYSTVNGSATAGSDYVAKPLTTVTFAAGQTTKTIAVTINGDTVDERNEAFSVQLSAPTAATISDASATVTIVDDDP